MARKGSTRQGKQMMCPFGKRPFATKREAEAAGVRSPKRCGRCRNWH